jgi:hypothetical protein
LAATSQIIHFLLSPYTNPNYLLETVQVELDSANCGQLGTALVNNVSSLGFQMMYIDAGTCRTDSSGNSTTDAYVVVQRPALNN